MGKDLPCVAERVDGDSAISGVSVVLKTVSVGQLMRAAIMTTYVGVDDGGIGHAAGLDGYIAFR